jgi:hypothetical protein
MSIHRHRRLPLQLRKQRGAAALITVLFLLIVVAFAVLVSLTMSGSDVSDSTSQHNSIQALFLAESGVERAAALITTGGAAACSATGLNAGSDYALGDGVFQVLAVPAPAYDALTGLCRLRVTGRLHGASRTVEVDLRAGGGSVYNFPDAASMNDWATAGPATTYRTTSFCPTSPGVIPAGTNDITAGYILANNSTYVARDAAQPTGANAGSFYVHTADITNGNTSGGRVAGYRETTLTSPITAGTTINASFYFRKERNGGQPDWIFMAIDLAATDGTLYRLWCEGASSDIAWGAIATSVAPFTVPAGKTIDRLRLVFDLKNKTSGAGTSDKRLQQVWWDQVNLGGGGATSLVRWTEP